MPFTPFHLGPGLLFGLLLFSYVDLPRFLVASVVFDIEPFMVLSLNLDYSVHGYLQTFVGGTIVAFLLVLAMSRMRGTLSPLMPFLKLEQKTSFSIEYRPSICLWHLSAHTPRLTSNVGCQTALPDRV